MQRLPVLSRRPECRTIKNVLKGIEKRVSQPLSYQRSTHNSPEKIEQKCKSYSKHQGESMIDVPSSPPEADMVTY